MRQAGVHTPRTNQGAMPTQSLQRAGGDSASISEAPSMVAKVLRSPGQPLDHKTRAFLEPRFGRDFSRVRINTAPAPARLMIGPPDDAHEREANAVAERIPEMATPPAGDHADFSRVQIHTDARAAESTRAVNALAYTVGRDVVFGSGQYAPRSRRGLHLLAHELTHVVQQNASAAPHLQRQLAGCQELTANPGMVGLIPGRTVHTLIGAHFRRTVPDARGVAIPGASADPQRSEGICGGEKNEIEPQVFGESSPLSGTGIPDLARITSSRELQVAEIKPAALTCLVDGETQLARYIDQGNATDAQQAAWRASLNVNHVLPMSGSAYPAPDFSATVGGFTVTIRTAWCTPGLLAYAV